MSVTAARGFQAAGVAAGIKASGRRDLALVRNVGPSRVAAGVFTSNRFKAAPVVWSIDALAGGELDAVVLNSGGANACTGADGLADARDTATVTASVLDSSPDRIAVCSTGLIGVRLPMDAVVSGVKAAAAELSEAGATAAAEAIMTTDTVSKQAAAASEAGWSVGGMAKGAGMLAPALATMLVVLTTDADLTAEQADAALRAATRVTFDRTDSDGCMSTNDTVILLASGASGVAPDAEEFTAALTHVCASLARQLLADAEGASHDIAVTVVNAATEDDALDVARAVTRSNLFKTAIFGNDPNWGRVLASAGTSRATFDPEQVSVSFNGVKVFDRGGLGEDRSLVDLTPREVVVEIDLAAGPEQATVWTNDLTYDYVKENAEYSS
ncbi:bifunctional glutamate N-acetyltransferase/amino-acid acetyltransferase ArgJ [Propioniciclava coleopterorum]|uniref:Arginine biosynthesis bifunctional protein ArgJ n=1 Tax=Propioniciclava coleopterorum TaxID=2714937 RepID=A0A6G7Y9C6_9ACTN|nr:bifunctional glutamate N-acetyltransferase/amino-acid acetyltransferase ArgJ [Propioniciclava coleopterorum]QIK73217.1 bifunctional glutamate N-acetyltransferase/amino-acid acetyltransferase ArgJ [Propioniciclava coleopterorum]